MRHCEYVVPAGLDGFGRLIRAAVWVCVVAMMVGCGAGQAARPGDPAAASRPAGGATSRPVATTQAEPGDAKEMVALGFRYQQGREVPQDYAQAMKWYRKSADGGDGSAMENIGIMHRDGLGVPQDTKEAFAWYQKAYDTGDEWAVISFGRSYANGLGVAKDLDEAEKWFRKGTASSIKKLQDLAHKELKAIGRE